MQIHKKDGGGGTGGGGGGGGGSNMFVSGSLADKRSTSMEM